MRTWPLVLALLALLAGCTEPQSSDYRGGAAVTGAVGVNLGKNASDEPCNQLPGATKDSVSIYCGTWQQPAATITATDAPGATPMGVATSSAWRDSLNLRFACDRAPTATSVLGGEPAALLQCRRLVGGWPQVALVTTLGGKTYQASGIPSTLSLMERSIGVQSGRITEAAATLPTSAADRLLTQQLAAKAFSAGDIGEYQRLMALGARANLAEDFASAETAYRAALALQQRALGRDNPDTVTALMHLALQVSDQGRFAEADALFKQADALAPRANDRAAAARLHHYKALHALNQGRSEQALDQLRGAEAGYAALIPPESLQGSRATQTVQLASASSAGGMAMLPNQRLVADPIAQSALVGLIETRRYHGIVLSKLGRSAESEAAINSALSLARANQIGVPLVDARLTRTSATVDELRGNASAADTGLTASRLNFTQVVPRTRPVAETALLQAALMAKQNDPTRAIEMCRTGIAILRELQSGTSPRLLEPCLAGFAAAASQRAGERQALLVEMFEAAQLAQDTMTSRQIAAAAVRLAANARDPNVAQAIRRRQDADDKVAQLYRRRDVLAADAPAGSPSAGEVVSPAELDRQIAEAHADLSDADSALQVAAPNYGQLIQQVVPAADVLAALRPDEALVSITVTPNGGWSFVLRAGAVEAVPLKGNAASISALVKRIRASVDVRGGPPPRFDTAAAQGLYDALLRPAAPQLQGANGLILVPTGDLLSIPFSLLLTDAADPASLAGAPWLIRQASIAHVPSAANFVALRRAGASRAAQPWFGFGGFRPATLAQAQATYRGAACAESARQFAGLPALPFAQRELDAARALLGARTSDELLNTAFTADAVRRAPLKGYRILHFATHALMPHEVSCQSEPAIVTSAPSNARDASGMLLSATDVTAMDLDADTVILSACNTGGPGNSTGGESLSGLARAFFFAGARSLEVTHWSVDDQVSAFLVVDSLRRIHDNPEQGMAAALRATQLGILDDAGKGLPVQVSHPYYWAPYALIGEGGSRTTRSAMR